MFKLKNIQLICFYVILLKDFSESFTTPLIVFNYEDNAINCDIIEDNYTNRTIIVENSTKLYQTNYRIRGFDYNLNSTYLVWSSNDYPYPIWMSEFKLRQDKTNKTRIQVTKRSIIAVKNPQTKLAVDWVHDLVYFFKQQALTVAHMSNPEVSYELTRKESPTDKWKYNHGNIAVNPHQAFVIWTEYNSIDGISIMRKCNLDGSDQKILVYKDIRIPICIAIDFTTQSILWIDNELHSLSSIDYFGNNRKTLKQSKDLFSDCSSMDILDGFVYWSSPKNNAIKRMNILGNDTQESLIETVAISDTDIDFVKIISKSNQKMSQNYCHSSNCSHICLPMNSENYRCLCSDILQMIDECNEPQIVYSSPKIPEQIQNTTAVSELFQSGQPLLLFTASKRDIRFVKLPDTQPIHYTDSEFLYKLDSYVSTIDYSIFGNFLVWLKTDVSIYSYLSKSTLFGSPIDETVNNSLSIDTMKPMVNLSENSLLKTMTIDWIHNLAYFPICESVKGIFVSNLSSPQVTYLLVPQTSCVTKDIRVDPIESYLFWSEYHETTGYHSHSYSYRYSSYSRYRNTQSIKSYIKRSSQDGQNVRTLVERQYVRKNSLTLDLEEKRIYWIDMNSMVNKLYAVDYEGENVITVNPSTTMFEDFSSMDLFKDHIYWTNTDDDTIRRITKNQSNVRESEVVLQSGIDIDAIRIIDTSRQPNGTNKCLNHNCPHICLPLSGENNFTCFCQRGQVWNSTTQLCVSTTAPSVTSSSSTTTVAPTRRVTTPSFSALDNETKLLFVIYKEGIYVKQNIYDLNTNYIESIELKSNNDWITELDFNFKDNYMLWLESSVFEGFSLYAAPIDKSRPNGFGINYNNFYIKKIVSKTYNSKRMAFDWIHKLVYLSVPKGIEVFSLGDDSYSYDIVKHDESQGDVAVDPIEGLVFWSQWKYTSLTNQHVGRIIRVNQDGSDQRVLTSSSKIPNTLTIDLESKTIYWIDTSLFSLFSIDYFGVNKTTILSIRNIFDGSFSMDVFGDYIFWSNYDKNSILMTEKSGANGSERIVLVNSYTDVEGIKVLDSSRQPNGTNRCLNNNCTSLQLCLPVQNTYRCVCSKSKIGLCVDNNVPEREMTSQSLPFPETNPINSHYVSNDQITNMSKRLDEVHALLNDTVLKTDKSETNHHSWTAIILISVAVNVILIAFLIYRKKKMNPFSKYIRAKFHNDREEVFLNERVDEDI